MGLMQNRVYQNAIHDVDELKQRLIAVWADMNQSVINKAIDEWRSRLAACLCQGTTFEHFALLNMSTSTSSLV